jgi:hypothetical protein
MYDPFFPGRFAVVERSITRTLLRNEASLRVIEKEPVGVLALRSLKSIPESVVVWRC